MKHLGFAVLLATLLAVLSSAGGVAGKSGFNFVAHLSGDNEIPPVDTNAQGQAIYKISGDETSIDFKLIVSNLDGITVAHIHCGAEDVNGPVVAFLFGPVSPGVSNNGVLAQGTITAVVPRPDSAECPGGVADMDDLIAKIRTGDTYTNVHTTANPSGAIRGQNH